MVQLIRTGIHARFPLCQVYKGMTAAKGGIQARGLQLPLSVQAVLDALYPPHHKLLVSPSQIY
jgi:hypothetical protein